MTIQACADLLQRGDRERFDAIMTAPVSVRAALFPIFAMNLEVARAPWASDEAMIAEMRLQWWRDAIEEIAQGQPAQRHEVMVPLAEVLDPEGAQLIDGLIEARRWDIYKDAFEDDAAFDAYIDATSGNLLWAACRAIGAQVDEAPVRQAAYGIGVANWLCAIPNLEERGRRPLVDGRPEAVRELARRARVRLQEVRGRPLRAAAPVLRLGWMSEMILMAAINDPRCVAEGLLSPSEVQQRVGLAWRGLTGGW